MVAANSLNISEVGFQSFDGVSVFKGRTLTAGAGISISNGTGVAGNPTISLAGGGTAIQTINGDTGSITGSSVTIFANRATLNSGSTVAFNNLGSVSTFNVTDAVNNTVVGKDSGSANLTTQGGNNTSFGSLNLTNVAGTITESCAFGIGVLFSSSLGSQNNAFGNGSLGSLTTGNANCAFGFGTGPTLLSGSNNIFIGNDSGNSYAGAESGNILIANAGVVGESKVTRIGLTSGGGQQTACYIAGITGVTVTASAPMAVDTNGQLSSLGFGTATQVLTSNGAGVSPSWQAAGGGSSSILSVGMTVAQSLAENALVDVIYDTVLIDTASAYNTGTGVYTVPTTGNYEITVTGNFLSTAGFTAGDLFVNKNAGTYLFHGQATATVANPNGAVMNASIVVALVATDTIKISMFSTTIGSTNYDVVAFSNGYFNTMSIVSL